MFMQYSNSLFSYIFVPDALGFWERFADIKQTTAVPLPNSSFYNILFDVSLLNIKVHSTELFTIQSILYNLRFPGTQQPPPHHTVLSCVSFLSANYFFLLSFTHILPSLFKKLNTCFIKVYSRYLPLLTWKSFKVQSLFLFPTYKDCISRGYEANLVPYSSLVL